MTVEPYLAALVWATRRPVRMVWTRQESLLARQKRHPFVMRYRTGVTRDGRDRRPGHPDPSATPAPTRCSARGCCSLPASTPPAPTGCDDARVESDRGVHQHGADERDARLRRDAGGVRATSRRWTGSPSALGLDPAEVRERNFVRARRPARHRRGDRHRAAARASLHATRALAELGEPPTPRPGVRVGRGFALQHAAVRPVGVLRRPGVVLDRARAGRQRWCVRAGVTDLGAGQAASLADDRGRGARRRPVDRISVHIGDSALTPLTRRHVRDAPALHVRQRGAEGGAASCATSSRRWPPSCSALSRGARRSPTNRVASDGGPGASITLAELARAAEARGVMPYHHDTFHAETGDVRPGDRPRPHVPGLHARRPRRRGRGRRGDRRGARPPVRRLPRRRPRDRHAARRRARSRAPSRRGSATRSARTIDVEDGVVRLDAVRRLPDPDVARPARHQGDRPRAAPRQGPVRRPRHRRAADRPARRGARERDRTTRSACGCASCR